VIADAMTDPEAKTYQFVFAGVAASEVVTATGEHRSLVEQLRERERQRLPLRVTVLEESQTALCADLAHLRIDRDCALGEGTAARRSLDEARAELCDLHAELQAVRAEIYRCHDEAASARFRSQRLRAALNQRRYRAVDALRSGVARVPPAQRAAKLLQRAARRRSR
jgi:chromosome segregation ATPase